MIHCDALHHIYGGTKSVLNVDRLINQTDSLFLTGLLESDFCYRIISRKMEGLHSLPGIQSVCGKEWYIYKPSV